jgi:hypothetical protein
VPPRGAHDPRAVIDLAERRAAQAVAIAPADAKRAWDAYCSQTADSVGRATVFSAAEFVSVEGSTVVIGFATEFARNLAHARLRAELEQSLSERLSTSVRVRCVVQALAPAAAVPDDPMERAALEIFRRPERIMEIE